MTGLDESQRITVLAVVARLEDEPGPLLEVLHGVQEALGHIPPAAVPLIAAALNLSHAEVHGVISFYRHFRSRPPGAPLVQLCRAESCRAMQAERLEAQLRARLGIGCGETTPDGAVTFEAVDCLGNCACSPALLIDGEPHGRVTAERCDELLAALRPRP